MLTKAVAFFLLAGAGLTPLDERAYSALVTVHPNQVLLVSFWATWCEPCRRELPQLSAMEHRFPAKDFRLAAVSIDEPEQESEARRLLRSSKFRDTGYIGSFDNRDKFIDSVDPKWSGALPALFLYDRAGHLVQSFIGEVNAADVERVVRRVLQLHSPSSAGRRFARISAKRSAIRFSIPRPVGT